MRFGSILAKISIAVIANLSSFLCFASSTPSLCFQSTITEKLRASSTNIMGELSARIPASGNSVHREAGLYGDENRWLMDANTYPWRTIGKLQVGDSICTAVLIGKCHLLTAGHCLSKKVEGRTAAVPKADPGKNIEFWSSNGIDHSAVMPMKMPKKAIDFQNDELKDYAFLKIEQPLGESLGYMGTVEKSSAQMVNEWRAGVAQPKDQSMIVAGFNGDLLDGEKMTVDSDIRYIQRSEKKPALLAIRGNTFAGASGAPLWRFDKNLQPEILGIHTLSAMTRNEDGTLQQMSLPYNEKKTLAVVVPTAVFYAEMEKFIRDNPCGN